MPTPPPTARVLLALLCLAALPACDTSSDGEEEEPPPEEELGPISLEYTVDAPTDAVDFAIVYTGPEGETVQVDTSPPFAFPFVENLEDALPADVEGTFGVRFTGFVPEGGIVVRVRATQDGVRVPGEDGEAFATAEGAGLGTQVSVEAAVTFGD